MKTRPTSVLFLAALFCAAASSSLSAADRQPKAIIQPMPSYPFELRKAEFEGAVLAKFIVTAKGDVTNAAVVGATNHVFEEPTLNAIRKWKFAPGTRNGMAVDIPVSQLVTFIVPSHQPETTTASLVAKLRPGRFAKTVASAR